MLELGPLSRGATKAGLLKEQLLCYHKQQLDRNTSQECTMSERIFHESVSPERGGKSDTAVMVNKTSSEHRDRPTSRNSSEDPSISTTHSTRHVSTNSRFHPRASSSNHVHNHNSGSGLSHDQKSRSHDRQRSQDSKSLKSHDHHHRMSNSLKRKRSHEIEEDGGGLWTEHTSSSGRVYYYNKKEDKSQWERPKGFIKKPKEEVISPTNKVTKTSSSSSLTTPTLKLATPFSRHSSTSHTHSHTHPRTHKDGSIHKESHRKPRHEHHISHRGEGRDKDHSSRHGSHSRSQSRSSSPPSLKSFSAAVRHKRTGATEKVVTDKTPSRNKSASGGKPVTSPITPKAAKSTSSMLVSPTTPVNIPSTLSQAISTTQQIIDQTSILIEQRQFLISGNGDTPTHVQQAGEPISTEHTPQHYHARQRLEFTPQNMLNGPSTPDVSMHGMPGLSSPQPGIMDTSGLHPLQRALMLQNQYSQQQQSYDPSLCMTPQSAIPAHLSQQGSHPNSPLVQSPLLQHGAGTPPLLTPPGALTPIQGGMFTMPVTLHGIYNQGLSGQGATLQSSTLQTPMSRLGYSMDNYSYPDVTLFKSVPQGGLSIDGELVDKSLSESWTRHNEPLQTQMDSCVRDTLQVSVTDPIHLLGKEATCRLRWDSVQLVTTSADNRLKSLNSLMDEINNR